MVQLTRSPRRARLSFPYAVVFMGEVVSQVKRLADFPESGRIVPEFGVAHLREIIHPPFRIVYRRDDIRVRIVRVWRSERLLKMP